MQNKFIHRVARFLKRPLGIFVIAVLALIIAGMFYFRPRTHKLELVQVTRGSITQQVSVTGDIKSISNVNLAFERTSKVARIYANVGDKVSEGQTLAALNNADLSAQLAQNQANLDAQNAKLDSLKAGARPEDIQVSKADLDKANQDLTNDYRDIPEAVNDAYNKANNAVRQQTDSMYLYPEQTNPQLAFTTLSSQEQIDLATKRLMVSTELNNWKTELVPVSLDSAQSILDQALSKAREHLLIIRDFLNETLDAVVNATNLNQTTVTSYKTNLNTAITNVNTALASIDSDFQTIASQKITVQKNQASLNLKLAGTSKEDIKAQEAVVAQARAVMQATQAELAKTVIRAPFSGTVTSINAKVGEIFGANTTAVSMISESNLEIDANIPETDIVKIKVGDPINITFDALPGEHWGGKVGFIDPAETVVGGVVNFKIKIYLDKNDPRLKSGLTANLAIETQRKNDTLILPQYAIVENDRGTFVRKPKNNSTEDLPVALGIRSQDGNVEVLTGVNEGDQVINIGKIVK